MKFNNAFSALSAASFYYALSSNALPTKRDYDSSDFATLNFALDLELLENAFYREGLSKFSQYDFTNAGYPSFAFGRYQQILEHESAHVKFLSGALGDKAVQECEYNFPYSDVKGFVHLSDMLETIGSSAYTGAANLLKTPDFVKAAAAILSTESRQSAFISSSVRGLNPWSTEFEAPLGMKQAFTLASGLIKSCPPANRDPSLIPFPTISNIPSSATPGSTILLSFTPSIYASQYYAAFISGLTTTFVPIHEAANGGGYEVQIPSELNGVSFLVITSDGTRSDDDVTVAGPAFLSFGFDENKNLVAPRDS